MVKFPEATIRIFKNKFVCRKCKSVVRAPNLAVIQGFVKCRKCGSRALRPVKRK
jgi:ribosomal protein L40E